MCEEEIMYVQVLWKLQSTIYMWNIAKEQNFKCTSDLTVSLDS